MFTICYAGRKKTNITVLSLDEISSGETHAEVVKCRAIYEVLSATLLVLFFSHSKSLSQSHIVA